MILRELIRMALARLVVHKVRSILTMLGVIIGTGAVVALISIGQGANSDVNSRIQNLGTNLLTVSAGSTSTSGVRGAAGSATTLTSDDATAIGKLGGVRAVSPETTTSSYVTFGSENTTTSVVGTTPDYLTTRDFSVQRGTFLTSLAQADALPVAVVGASVLTDLDTTSDQIVGHDIQVAGASYRVIGVLQPKGGSGIDDPDDEVLIPFSRAQKELVGSNSVRTIDVSVKSNASSTEVQAEITALLDVRHNISSSSDADFTITSQSQLEQTFSSVNSTLTYLLAGVAAISLLVGGIGIMNMMLVSVQERTYEIGLRKALGARSRDVLAQFLSEAVVLSVLGGVLGVLAGIVASRIVSQVAGWSTVLSVPPMLLAFAFSLLVGIVFGVIPAWSAARLDPVKALRYQ